MKFSHLITTLGLCISVWAHASHVNDRSIYQTDVKKADGTSVFSFPTAHPTSGRVCTFNSDGEATSSSVTEASLIQSILPDQTGNSGKFLTTNGSATSWGSVPSAGITALTGDVSATGPGSSAATVNSVGGSTAANVHAAELLANAATNNATASAIVKRDANANTRTNNFINGYTSTVSSAGTVTMTAASTRIQVLTGTQNHTYTLPNATTLVIGQGYEFDNNSTGTLTVKNASSTTQFTVPAGGKTVVNAVAVSTSAGSWDWHEMIPANATWGTAGLTTPGGATLGAQESISLSNTSFLPNTTTDHFRFLNPSGSNTSETWRFGSTDVAQFVVQSAGNTYFRQKGQMAWQFGSDLSSGIGDTVSISSGGVYSGAGVAVQGSVSAGYGTFSPPAKLTTYGGYAAKSRLVTGDTSLDNQSQFVYCDTANAHVCSGTATACSTHTYSGCNAFTDIGCAAVTDGNCSSAGDNTDSGTCTGLGGGGHCTWQTSACSPYTNNAAACNSAGFPSGGQCTFTAATCSDFNTPESCAEHLSDNCSPSTAECSGFDDAECTSHVSLGCVRNTTSCSTLYPNSAADCNAVPGCTAMATTCNAFDGNQVACEAIPFGECTYNTGDDTCNGDYNTSCNGDFFSSCSGNYFTACGGSYSGPNGVCSGSFDTGNCLGGNYGHCGGSASCRNLTTLGQSTCTSYSPCAWTEGMTITLPSLASHISNDAAFFAGIKKVSGGEGIVTIVPSSTDKIEDATSMTLTPTWSSVMLHAFIFNQDCSSHLTETPCSSDSHCTWVPAVVCSSYNGDQSGCEGHGCTYNTGDDTCSGSGSSASCSGGVYVASRQWTRWGEENKNIGYRAITASYTPRADESTIEVTANSITLTLPTAVGNTGHIYYLKNTGSGTVTLATTSSQTIDGSAPGTISAGGKLTLQSNGTNWISL